MPFYTIQLFQLFQHVPTCLEQLGQHRRVRDKKEKINKYKYIYIFIFFSYLFYPNCSNCSLKKNKSPVNFNFTKALFFVGTLEQLNPLPQPLGIIECSAVPTLEQREKFLEQCGTIPRIVVTNNAKTHRFRIICGCNTINATKKRHKQNLCCH